jgi:Domain of unknown function (DUF4410)
MRYRNFAFAVVLLAASAQIAAGGPLQDVKIIEVGPTIVPNPAKVKDAAAPGLVQDYLRQALLDAGFQIGKSPVKAHMVLNQFTSGNRAKRFAIGFGVGRSAITAHLVIRDGRKNEIVDARIHIRGNVEWSPYEGAKTQRRQAEKSFEEQLLKEIHAKIWKGPKHKYAGKYTAIIVPQFTLAPGVEFSSKDLTNLQEDIVKRLQNAGFQHVVTTPEAVPSGSAAIKLTGMVIKFKAGNRVARYIGGGVGRTDLESSITLTDVATGRRLLERQLVSSTHDATGVPFGGIYGVAQSSKGYDDGLSKKLAVLLKDYFF